MSEKKPQDSSPPNAAEEAKAEAAVDQVLAEPAAPPANDELAKLRQEVAELKDRWLRSQAELENFRKRAARELSDSHRYGGIHLLRELLPVVDNIALAIEAGDKGSDAATLLQGFKMVAQQLETILQQHHCKRIEALHAPFDPSQHEAIMQMPSGEHPENTVIQVTRQGYQLYDRIVRPSQVIVSKAVAASESPS